MLVWDNLLTQFPYYNISFTQSDFPNGLFSSNTSWQLLLLYIQLLNFRCFCKYFYRLKFTIDITRMAAFLTLTLYPFFIVFGFATRLLSQHRQVTIFYKLQIKIKSRHTTIAP